MNASFGKPKPIAAISATTWTKNFGYTIALNNMHKKALQVNWTKLGDELLLWPLSFYFPMNSWFQSIQENFRVWQALRWVPAQERRHLKDEKQHNKLSFGLKGSIFNRNDVFRLNITNLIKMNHASIIMPFNFKLCDILYTIN